MAVDAPAPIQLRHPGAAKILARCLKYLSPYWRYTATAYLLRLDNSGISLVPAREGP